MCICGAYGLYRIIKYIYKIQISILKGGDTIKKKGKRTVPIKRGRSPN